jgi:hypothetical protein
MAGAIFHAAMSKGKFQGIIWPTTPRGSGVIEEMGSDDGQIHIACFLDWLAAIHGFEDGQFAGFFLNDAGNAIEILAALAARHLAPDFLISAAGGFHSAVHVLFFTQGDLGQFFFRRGIDGVEILSGDGRDKFAVNEQFIARRDLYILRGFRRGGVVPLIAEHEAAFFEGNDLAPGGGGAIAFDQREGTQVFRDGS